MSANRARFIPDLLETHFEELEYLWGRRRAALTSALLTLRDFIDLNERVEAHIQGLLAVRAYLPKFLVQRLEEEGRDGVFAAACPLLRLSDADTTALLLDTFSTAQGSRLAGLRDAFGFAPAGLFAPNLRKVVMQGGPTHAVAAAGVLANQRLLDPATPRLMNLLEDEAPEVAELAWLAITLCDSANLSTAPVRPFKQGLLHDSPRVRSAAWRAAAWTRQSWALPSLRKLAGQGDRIALEWLVALGKPEDLQQIMELVFAMESKADGCELLARFGHPKVLDLIGKWMMGEDIVLASAAGDAFARLTGADIRGVRKTAPVAEDADEFTREFAPDVWLPDMNKAKAFWQQHKQTLAGGTRWRQGIDLGGECTLQTLIAVDLEARWDAYARAALAGRPLAAPPPIS
ncbi:MAG: hypothetical protein NTX45_02185 [Proteobacteria bacterium]|nr:hypothetical protein [Pseudomonadota bacterium]